jgi:Putative rhamnosyl transferase
MSEKFTHLLLTRFNTAIDYAPSAKRLEMNWLTARLALFVKYCLPSVAGQEGAEFLWLVFCDAASPEWFKEKMVTFEPLVKPIYIDGPGTDEVIARKVMETGFVSAPYLITTRLDNDDAIARNHLALVQSAFRKQDREFITFPFGLQSFRGHLYNVYWPSNPFLSLIEKVSDNLQVTTVLCVRHDHVGGANKLRKVLGSSKWLQVLHDSNVANTLRGWPRLNSRFHPSFRVAWPEKLTADSIASRLRFSTRTYVMRVGLLINKSRRSAKKAAGSI